MASLRRRTWTTAAGGSRECWQVDFVDQHGKRRHRQFARKKDADRWLVDARHQVDAGVYSPDSSSITVAEAAGLWLERCARDELESATLRGYRSHVVHHIQPLLGNVQLSRLSKPRVEQFADRLLAEGRTRATSRKILGSLVSLIGEAQRRGLVAQNVATGVRISMPKRHQTKVAIPTKVEVREALAGAVGRKRVVLLVAVFTGMRASEIRGLQWGDVEFAAQSIRVRQRADDSGRLGALKSATSRRDLPMPPLLLNALREWKLASGGDGLVFSGRRGRPLAQTSIRQLLGRVHRYRHFYASWLIDQGFAPKRVQTLMGHSTIQMTFDVYGHLFPAEDDQARFAAAERALLEA